MKIREQACDSNIVISKFKFNCDECDKSIPKPLPQNLNHFMMIVGKPGSSKTTLLLNMVCKRGKMYNKKYDRVYLWSPSLGTIDDCPFNDLPEDQVHEELTEENLEGVLDDIRDTGEKVLFMIDDCVNDMKKEARLEKLLAKVLMNRRHICGAGGALSVWITTQVFNLHKDKFNHCLPALNNRRLPQQKFRQPQQTQQPKTRLRLCWLERSRPAQKLSSPYHFQLT
jgi:hypothetical protein